MSNFAEKWGGLWESIANRATRDEFLADLAAHDEAVRDGERVEALRQFAVDLNALVDNAFLRADQIESGAQR